MTRLDRPIIIIGAPRSGTTLLGKLFAAHPALAYSVEPRLIWRWGNDRKSDLLTVNDARPEVIKSIRGSFDRIVDESGRSRLLEKTPSNALRIPFVDRVFPDARFIHIVRNGFESVLGIRAFWQQSAHGGKNVAKGRLQQRLKEIELRRLPFYAKEAVRRYAPAPARKLVGENVWGPRLPGIDALVRDLDKLEVACLQWRWCVELACADGRKLPTDRYFELRLEDLSEDTLNQAVTFAGLSDGEPILQAYRDNFKAEQVSHRSASASDEELAVMTKWMAATNQWLGYE